MQESVHQLPNLNLSSTFHWGENDNSYSFDLNNELLLGTDRPDNNSNPVSSWNSFDSFNGTNIIPYESSQATLSLDTLHWRLRSVQAALFRLQFRR